MTPRTVKRAPVTREGIVADLRRLADLAEEGGDRVSAVRALKYACHIERCGRTNPSPPSIDRIIEVGESVGPLIYRFAPEDAGRIAADIAELRRYQIELAKLEQEIATLH